MLEHNTTHQLLYKYHTLDTFFTFFAYLLFSFTSFLIFSSGELDVLDARGVFEPVFGVLESFFGVLDNFPPGVLEFLPSSMYRFTGESISIKLSSDTDETNDVSDLGD